MGISFAPSMLAVWCSQGSRTSISVNVASVELLFYVCERDFVVHISFEFQI